MRPAFQYTCDPPVARLRVSGELDLSTGDQLLDIFRQLAFRHITTVELDVSAITFIDAFTLGLLHREQCRLRTLGGDLCVVAASLWYTLVSQVAQYDTLQVVAEGAPSLRVLHEAPPLHVQDDC